MELYWEGIRLKFIYGIEREGFCLNKGDAGWLNNNPKSAQRYLPYK